METKYSSIESLKAEIIEAAHSWYKKGLEKFPQKEYPLEIHFNDGGTVCAGEAYTAGIHTETPDFHRLDFNLDLARNNQQDFLSQTVPHEVAHVIANTFFAEMLNGGTAEHGDFWKIVMLKFGKEPKQFHEYDVRHVFDPKLPEGAVIVKCENCGQKTWHGKALQKKIDEGFVFSCPTCKKTGTMKLYKINVLPADDI